MRHPPAATPRRSLAPCLHGDRPVGIFVGRLLTDSRAFISTDWSDMRDSQPDRDTVAHGGVSARGNGKAFGLPTDPLDRGHLLRRSSRFPFPRILVNSDPIRLRRERRVSASFSGIPPLSRNDHA